MEISYIDEFVMIAETKSFKRTAEHYFVSRSVISRHISALEEAVGVRLLERDSHNVCLTEVGEVFYREAKTILRDWEIAIERVHSMSEGEFTLVRLGYLRNAARPVLTHFVCEMKRRYPEIRLSLVCMDHHELIRALAEHAVDLALAVEINPEISRGYRSTPVYQDHFTVVCAQQHPLAAYTDGVSLEQLHNEPLLMPDSYVYGGTADFIKEVVDEETMSIARAFYNDADMLTLKVETEGILALSSTINNTLFLERLAILPIKDVDTSFRVCAFYNDSFTGVGYQACAEVFEWCNVKMNEWYPSLAMT